MKGTLSGLKDGVRERDMADGKWQMANGRGAGGLFSAARKWDDAGDWTAPLKTLDVWGAM